ncbi:steroidogenic acute regulatory protein, mitochondrial isoform X3 [Cynoglossus semilaevis]|uniref:steroidogenic acute regulatory protein, mitochondrial isoform X3 n=1 Tax=Cynoglossus semilaevis TaxID=244447 RepID=UPI000D62C7BF|nr:steroidogenic acute regulatory protein, mitochondrial-like isoform X3 [Cynoglossus semilaevis]
MLPAVVKLCCGISYPHLRSTAVLQCTAVAVIGQEFTSLQRPRAQIDSSFDETKPKRVTAEPNDPLFHMQLGQQAMLKALRILEDKDGWEVRFKESNGDVICSKVIPGARTVFRLEAVLEASVDELYDLLFARVEEMHKWNPQIQHIKVLKHIGPKTIVTHEVSERNLFGQRDFLSVRHSCKQKSRVYLGGGAIKLEKFPPQAGFVRGWTHMHHHRSSKWRKQKKPLHMAFKYGCQVLAATVDCRSHFASKTAGFH